MSSVCTFLFTDIEGSTRRWEADAEAMRAALETHNSVLRAAIEARRADITQVVAQRRAHWTPVPSRAAPPEPGIMLCCKANRPCATRSSAWDSNPAAARGNVKAG